MGERTELPNQFKDFLRDAHKGLARACWLRVHTILEKDCPIRRSEPKATVDLMTEDEKATYNTTIRRLTKMTDLNLREFTGLQEDEFNFLLQQCGIKNASGKWNIPAVGALLNDIPGLGSNKLDECRPWKKKNVQGDGGYFSGKEMSSEMQVIN